jgi:AraC-like DNA-binding protein/mannose-6-phosphate isomerase-like protein (cupin superfamily)
MHAKTRIDRAEVMALRTVGGPVEVMRASYHTQSFPRHTHEFFTVGVVTCGAGSLWCRHAEHVAMPGDVVIIPPGEVHTGSIARGADVLSYIAVHAPADALARCAGVAPDFSDVIVHDVRVAAQLMSLDRSIRGEDGDASEAVATALMLLADRHAVNGQDGRSRGDEVPALVRRAREVLEDCFGDNERTSLDALSAQVGVTPFHLVRAFTRATGLSPHRYLVQTRVRRARELLAGGMSCSFVAATTGFADQSHLTTQFKRYLGITPASYQRCLSRRSQTR